MTFLGKFGEAQASVTLKFRNSVGAQVGSTVTTGIVALAEPGAYTITMGPPANAVLYEFGRSGGDPITGDITELSSEVVAALATAANGGQILLGSPYVYTAGPSVILPVSTNPDLCLVWLDTEILTGQERTDLEISVMLIGGLPTVSSGQYLIGSIAVMTPTSGTPGRYEIDLPRGVKFLARCNLIFAPQGREFTTPNATLFQLTEP